MTSKTFTCGLCPRSETLVRKPEHMPQRPAGWSVAGRKWSDATRNYSPGFDMCESCSHQVEGLRP